MQREKEAVYRTFLRDYEALFFGEDKMAALERAYIFDELFWNVPPPQRPRPAKRGPHVRNKSRDAFIVEVIKRTVSLGFAPTRGEASRNKERNPSACSIVRAALASNGLHLTESAVDKIWNKRRHT
jgi:hypothetical protein